MKRWYDWRLRTKLLVCFSSILVLFLLVGLFVRRQNIVRAKNDAILDCSNSVERAFLKARFHYRAYYLSGNMPEYERSQLYLDSLLLSLDYLEKLAKELDTDDAEMARLTSSLLEMGRAYESKSHESFESKKQELQAQSALREHYLKFYAALRTNEYTSSAAIVRMIALGGKLGEYFDTRSTQALIEAQSTLVDMIKQNLFESEKTQMINALRTSVDATIQATAAKDEVGDTFIAMSNQLSKLIVAHDNRLEQLRDASYRYYMRIEISLFALAVLNTIVSLPLLTNFVVRMVKAATAKLQECADGRFVNDVPKNYQSFQDEFGAMARAIATMIDKTRETLNIIKQSADEVARASEQLNSNSQILSQGSNSQAANAEEVSSAMEEMSANIDSNAERAQSSQTLSRELGQRIEELSTESRASLESVETISSKILVISEIATQTNILALNAAVEAARAGDHGRGFSVVAAEVRKLAERSNDAANEIVHLAEQSREATQKSHERLDAVLPDMARTRAIMEEIAVASDEQRGGVNQITMALNALNEVIQNNASSSQEMSASATQLSEEAEKLRQAIEFFSLV